MFNASENPRPYSETDLIHRINRWLGPLNPKTPEGIGDDCAVLPKLAREHRILTTDSLTYGQHFDDSVPPEDAGAKLVNRNLSDIAAMGGLPDRAILTLMFGPNLSIDWLERFFRGIVRASTAGGLQIVGGDVSRLEPGRFSSSLTIVGIAENPILRGTAQVGDHIYVTGELGGSLAGKHYAFAPRLAEGRWLAEQGNCTSLMDLTDGLAKDLPNLLPKQASARIDLEAIPIAGAAREAGGDTMEHAFRDGEDYELLFTVGAKVSPHAFAKRWHERFPKLRLSRIGEVAEGAGPRLVDAATGRALPWTRGFEHFPAEP